MANDKFLEECKRENIEYQVDVRLSLEVFVSTHRYLPHSVSVRIIILLEMYQVAYKLSGHKPRYRENASHMQ